MHRRRDMFFPPVENLTYLSNMENDQAPYTVDVGRGDPIPVSPSDLDPKETTLRRISGQSFIFRYKGVCYPMTILQPEAKKVRIWSHHHAVDATVRDEKDQLLDSWGYDPEASAAERELVAPMPGLVLSVAVAAGQHVSAGDPLLVLEAMKMENELRAESDCTVEAVRVAAGEAVGKKQVLIEFSS